MKLTSSFLAIALAVGRFVAAEPEVVLAAPDVRMTNRLRVLIMIRLTALDLGPLDIRHKCQFYLLARAQLPWPSPRIFYSFRR
jgi:hypothetical protein